MIKRLGITAPAHHVKELGEAGCPLDWSTLERTSQTLTFLMTNHVTYVYNVKAAVYIVPGISTLMSGFIHFLISPPTLAAPFQPRVQLEMCGRSFLPIITVCLKAKHHWSIIVVDEEKLSMSSLQSPAVRTWKKNVWLQTNL